MSTWDWQVFCKDTIDGELRPSCFGQGGDITYLDWLLSAWGWTLSVASLALVVALIVGSLMGIFRTVPSKALVAIGNVWTELFRNIPLLVQVFLWYHVLPSLIPALRAVPSFVLVVLALGFFTSARIAEQVRAGIESLPKGQRYAGLAMGLTLPQTYRYVLLPMAYRIVIPPLTSEFMNIFKNSAVALAIGLTELTFQMRQITGEYAPANPIEVMTVVSALYLLVAFSVNRVMALIERKTRVPGYISGGH